VNRPSLRLQCVLGDSYLVSLVVERRIDVKSPARDGNATERGRGYGAIQNRTPDLRRRCAGMHTRIQCYCAGDMWRRHRGTAVGAIRIVGES
jgi:hypothetical protein